MVQFRGKMKVKDYIFFTMTVLVSVVVTASGATAQNVSATAGQPAESFVGVNTIADVAQKAAPAVVNIVAVTSLSRDQALHIRSEQRLHDHGSKRVKKYFDMDSVNDESDNQIKATGSGIIVRSDGFILTSLHVVQNSSDIKVTLADGRRYTANLVGKDSFTDLALIKIDANSLPEAKFGNANQLRLGEWVVAIGNQFGLEHTVTAGLISGLHREAKAFTPSFGARTGAVKFIQTDASINPGSSGGPLLNLRGEIVGVNSFIRDDAQNIGFAIPVDIACEVAKKLIKEGVIVHPYIGIEMRDPSELISLKPGDNEEGVEITRVKSAGPANTAGLEIGDRITEVGNAIVRNPTDVSQAVGKHAVGEAVKVRVKRNGAERTVVVKIAPLPDEVE